MFKFKRNLIYSGVLAGLLVILAGTIPALRSFSLEILKIPFNCVTLARREILGIIFYHRNLVQREQFIRHADSLRRKLNESEELYLENARLRELVSFRQRSPYRVIAARVIARSPDNWSSAVIIDKGRLSRIKRDYTAITQLGLVGKVIETTDSTSKILLINDPNLGVSAMVQRSRQEGLISGSLGGSLVMKYLPKDADINISDVIITSGLGSIYSKGLVIGQVVEVGDEFSGLGRYAIIKPAVNLSSLEEVMIIIP